MKNTKCIYILLLFLLLFIKSSGSYSCTSENITFENVSFGIQSLIDDEPDLISQHIGTTKELDIHLTSKKKIKYRAVTSESSTLKSVFYSEIVNFTVDESSFIYGIVSLYDVELHTYLHLYQLF